jgi:hypothetical protein
MAAPEKILRILPFPQSFANGALELRVVLVPTQALLYEQDGFPSHEHPGGTVSLPRFIKADPFLDVTIVHGLAGYPYEDLTTLKDVASATTTTKHVPLPPGLPALYEGLATQFAVAPTAPATGAELLPAGHGIRKYLPRSYRQAFNFTRARTPAAATDDAYHCAVRRSPDPDPTFRQSTDALTWGNVIAFCLRQPLLAERMGLIHRVTLDEPGDLKDGGWVYASLASPPAEFGIPGGATLQRYAARIPPLTAPRRVFAAVLFPVMDKPPQPLGDFDTLKIEAADYDDGFAQIVHAVQPMSADLLAEDANGIHVQKDLGIRLGWDDEQILIWQNRQVQADLATGARLDAPLGVFSYRVDVRAKGAVDWESLVRVRNTAALALAGQTIAPAGVVADNGVQVFPSRINADPATRLWLPAYFSQWYGASLALPDDRAAQLDPTGALRDPGRYSDGRVDEQPKQKGGLYEPLLPADTELKYGEEYEFRVRLADLSGGGPELEDAPLNDAPAPVALLRFRRYIAPKQLKVTPVAVPADPKSRGTRVLDGDVFEIARPRLGYPALLFTGLNADEAMAKLVEDRDVLYAPGQPVKEPRAVSWFDPDVERMLVVVDLRTLALDTAASRAGDEAFIPLYTTFRDFNPDPATPFSLELEYRDANVIDFADPATFGDLALSQDDIDAGGPLVLPTSRDIRITLLPVCPDKPGQPAYFGFAPTVHAGELVRTGEPTQFFVRQDATDEFNFFRKPGEPLRLQGADADVFRKNVEALQGIYLQPDPPTVINQDTIERQRVEGREADRPTPMQRLASQLGVEARGLTLIGLPGERIHFGCSHRIRHTLAPDHSSLTFATDGELLNHWLMDLSFDVLRDWTWDGLAPAGITIERTKQFTGEAAILATETVGRLQMIRTASRVATDRPQRSYARVVFIDAVEPKKDVTEPATAAHPFPNTIDASYTLTPSFVTAVDAGAAAREQQSRALRLPVTTIPAQVPKVVSVGYALSPYRHDADYASTAVRQRFLWLELDRPVDDPHDTCFARVLAYAPDPLLSFGNDDLQVAEVKDAPFAIDPELIRVITAHHGNDGAGLDAMQEMRAEDVAAPSPMIKASPVHYLLPLPPGLHADSPELFGFYVYELRIGHGNAIWSTAQGRFGHPLRLTGVQHPAPVLTCLVDRVPAGLSVTALHATAVFGSRNVTMKPPATELWAMLYAQVSQADGKGKRNLLLAETRLEIPPSRGPLVREFLVNRLHAGTSLAIANSFPGNLDAPATTVARWTEAEIEALLHRYGLALDTPLSVLAVEMMPRYDRFLRGGPGPDLSVRPLSQQLGRYRILRSSTLVAAPEICCASC